MPTRWGLFAGAVVLVTIAFLALARATSDSFLGDESTTTTADEEATTGPPDEADGLTDAPDAVTTEDTPAEPRIDESEPPTRRLADLDARTLLVDAVISQVLVGLPLVAITWYAEIPWTALGLSAPVFDAILPGTAIGLVVYAANEAGALAAKRLGVDADERLREMLAPGSGLEWALLLLVALPLIAAVEEFLFRAALIGGLSAGYGLHPALLALLSSVAFGLGHGLQGTGGVLVAGILGLALAAAFVATGSLWVVIIAHYVVNAMEFVVHEGLGVEF